MVRLRVLSVWCLAACGRIGFDVPGEDEFLACEEPFGAPASTTTSLTGIKSPTLSTDGLELILNAQDSLWSLTRSSHDAPWGPPVEVTGPWLLEGNIALSPSLSGDGLELYYMSPRNSNAYIFRATRATRSSPWSDEQGVSSVTGDGDIASDGLSIYAQDYRSPIMVATRASTSQPFGPAAAVGPPVEDGSVNTSPSISFDGRELYFQSNRNGGVNRVYVARRSTATGPFETVEDVGLPFSAETPEIAPNGRDLYVSASVEGRQLFVTRRCP